MSNWSCRPREWGKRVRAALIGIGSIIDLDGRATLRRLQDLQTPSERIPESREVWKHGNREYDRRDARLCHLQALMVGVIIGFVLAVLLGALS